MNNVVQIARPTEFDLWLRDVDRALEDGDQSRHDMPFLLHQWWELWDHGLHPESAAIAAEFLQPAATKPWPEHYVYVHNYTSN